MVSVYYDDQLHKIWLDMHKAVPGTTCSTPEDCETVLVWSGTGNFFEHEDYMDAVQEMISEVLDQR